MYGETEACNEGGIDVCNIENGDYIKVKGVIFGSGAESFAARIASATNGGKIELRIDSPTGTLVGTCVVAGTGSWKTWVTKSCTVSGATVTHDLYLKFTGGSGSLFNFNWQSSIPSNITFFSFKRGTGVGLKNKPITVNQRVYFFRSTFTD